MPTTLDYFRLSLPVPAFLCKLSEQNLPWLALASILCWFAWAALCCFKIQRQPEIFKEPRWLWLCVPIIVGFIFFTSSTRLEVAIFALPFWVEIFAYAIYLYNNPNTEQQQTQSSDDIA